MTEGPYDPLPDIAAVLAGVWSTPAHNMPASTVQGFSRLARKLRFEMKDLGHLADAGEIEAALRHYLTGLTP